MKYKIRCIENNYNNIKFSLNRSYEITDNYITKI